VIWIKKHEWCEGPLNGCVCVNMSQRQTKVKLHFDKKFKVMLAYAVVDSSVTIAQYDTIVQPVNVNIFSWNSFYFILVSNRKISGGETMGNLCIISPHLSHWHPLLTYIFILCFMSSSSSMKSGIVLRYNTRSTTRSTQPCIPPGSLNRVPASAGVRAGMSPLPGGR